ncbi:MAG: hypothetical protein AAFX65_10600 [Cyanobacteria bacterium J06638_7]
MPPALPAPPINGAQLAQALLELEAETGAGSTPPVPPFAFSEAHAALQVIAAAVGGVAVPALPMTGAQLYGVLEALWREVWPEVPVPGQQPPQEATGGDGGVLTGEAPPLPTQGGNGSVYLQVVDGRLVVYGPKAAGDWGDPVWEADTTPVPPPRRLALEKVRSGERWVLERVVEPTLIVEVSGWASGTPDRAVPFTFRHGPEPDGAGTEVVTGGMVATLGEVSTQALNAPVIPAGHWLWFETGTVLGTVDHGSFGLRFGSVA